MDGGLSLIFSRAGTLSRPAACTIFIGTRRGPRRRTSCVPLNQSLAPKTDLFLFSATKVKVPHGQKQRLPTQKKPPQKLSLLPPTVSFPPLWHDRLF